MNLIKEVKSDRLGESYFEVQHAAGLKIMIYPKPENHSTYAIFGTNYGSIDNTFRRSDEGEAATVPNGIAHYLEHKMFESEDGDAFARYAKTGASANAYTSFDKTCYLFSCAANVYDSLEILLDFVQHPYFTEKTVQKEQGIIGQEIRMYDDDPTWRVLFNMLGGMYHNHPVKIDIAGTVESIAQITPELLYRCYHTFYNLNNMALCVVGNVEENRVLELCDRMLKPSADVRVERIFQPEPETIVQPRICAKGSVVTPLFYYGFKEKATHQPTDQQEAATEILLEMLFGESSPLFRRLLDSALINEASFSYEYFNGPGYACVLFSGESKNPDAVAQAICGEAEKARREGLDPAAFARAQKAVYGRIISSCNSVETIANTMIGASFAGRSLYGMIEAVAQATCEQVEARLQEQMLPDRAVLSIIEPD